MGAKAVRTPGGSTDTRERDIDAALETASACRQDASIMRQCGFQDYARWLDENARKAERWAAKR